jgi:hypothetical protein
MHGSRDSHWALIKRILRYIRGTSGHGMHIIGSTDVQLRAYSDADGVDCSDIRRSTSGYYVFLGDSLVSWSFKWQMTVSHSNAEVKYRAVVNATAECCWLRQLLQELYVIVNTATVMYCDNISVVL